MPYPPGRDGPCNRLITKDQPADPVFNAKHVEWDHSSVGFVWRNGLCQFSEKLRFLYAHLLVNPPEAQDYLPAPMKGVRDLAEADLHIAIDEFGSLEAVTLPGQTTEELAFLVQTISEELEPAGFLGRLYARDLALRTSFAEFLRKAKVAMLKELLERTAPEAGGSPGNSAADLWAQLGKVFADNLGLIEQLTSIEINVGMDRDRVVQLFDNRRLEAVKLALSVMEGKANDLTDAFLEDHRADREDHAG